MKQKTKEYVNKMHMIEPGDKVIVALSGGADSVCLFWLLQEMAEEIGFELEAVHVEHGIRGQESCQDADFVENLCEKMHIFCHVYHVDVLSYAKEHKLGIEEAARVLRYEAFEKVASESGERVKIALAHHMDDNAETMLFQMVRGSGLTGACGLLPVRTDDKGVTYIRPLLLCTREEIEQQLKEYDMDYCVDSTNADIAYSRNRIRLTVLPELRQINSRAVNHMSQLSQNLQDLEEFVNSCVSQQEEILLHKGLEEAYLDAQGLKEQPKLIQKEVVMDAISFVAGQRKDLQSVHVEAVLELLEKQSGRQVDLPYQMSAVREYDRIRLYKKEVAQKTPLELSFDRELFALENGGNGVVVSIPNSNHQMRLRVIPYKETMTEIPKKAYTKWLNYDKIIGNFQIRNRQSGDYFVVDVFGHKKKLKEYLIDQKIPASQRDEVILLAAGQEIIWMVGGRISENYKVNEDTEYILEVEYLD